MNDTELLDGLAALGNDTGWTARQSTTGRGFRLHQPGPFATPREAIADALGEESRELDFGEETAEEIRDREENESNRWLRENDPHF